MEQEIQDTPTKEEYEKRKAEMLQHYQDELPFMKAQLEYENTITLLEEARARYLRAQRMIADISAPPPTQAPEERKLRKE